MAEIFDTLLLLALPASGKSEVRTYLSAKSPEKFHMGPTVQIDDYPYVHLQLRIDEELDKMGQERIFHAYLGGPFISPFEWGGLIRLLDEDYHELLEGRTERPDAAALRLFERFDSSIEAAGGKARLASLPMEVHDRLADIMEEEARALFDQKAATCPTSLEGKTVVIEFARGGPMGHEMPLLPGYGYAGSLSQFSPECLNRAAVLYIWVDPEESRRKNRARARPDGQGSILFHGTPEPVMYEEYGCDDIEHLISLSDVPDTMRIESHGKVFLLPVARFDNRADKTSFLREPPDKWEAKDIDAIHGGLLDACDRLWAAYVKRSR